jgi:hypothetical protein
MSANPETHQFDRRASDVNVSALSTRVTALEGRVEALEKDVRDNTVELRANTALTKQVHEALHGRDGDDEDLGLKGKVGEMHKIFADAMGTVRTCKRVMWPVVGLVGAIVVWWKTGEFKWPELPH